MNRFHGSVAGKCKIQLHFVTLLSILTKIFFISRTSDVVPIVMGHVQISVKFNLKSKMFKTFFNT